MSDKILIAEDNADNRNLLSFILRRQGFEVIEAVDGEMAVHACEKDLPDVVLLDIEMPKKDGFEVLEDLMANEHTKDTPVIFLSARTMMSSKIKGFELGAIDYITKPFDKAEVIARVKSQLKIRQLTKSLQNANFQLQERQKALDEDLKAAAQIQKALIPKSPPPSNVLEFAWQFIPCEHIGGDIFNIHRLNDAYIAIYIVDVSGHGVPSAMVTVSVSQSLQPGNTNMWNTESSGMNGNKLISPAEILDFLDREYPLERFDKYFTIAYCLINERTGEIVYSSAAHPNPVVVRKNGDIEILDKGGTIIGLGGLIPFEEGHTRLAPGDRLILYTDGLVEHTNTTDELFGIDNLYHALKQNQHESIQLTCQKVIQTVMEHGGEVKPRDDITIVAIDYRQMP